VFTSAVIGGLGSLGGAVLGAVYLRGIRWFITSQEWQLLSTGGGVLLVLLILPGGLGGLWITVRDICVRLLVRPSQRRTDNRLTTDVPASDVTDTVPMETVP
jgi:hypothetical protein